MKKLFPVFIVLLMVFALAGCAAIGQQVAGFVADDIAAAVVQDEVTPTPVPAEDEDVPAVDTSNFLLEEQTLIDLYERLNPSVVNIRVIVESAAVTVPEDEQQPFPPLPEIPGFPELPQIEPVPPGPQGGVGSGFVYDKEGHIITDNHVVANASRIVVTFADESEAEATLVGADPDSDLAVIQVDVDPDRLVPVTLGDSDALRVGQFVVAIGNPFGLEGSMTTGIISGLGRLLPAGAQTPGGPRFSIPEIIQTDAAVNPGNSGGPLLNMQGEVIGVNTAIESPIRAFGGIGYAVPSNTVTQVVPELIETGRVEHPWLGIAGTTLSLELAQAMELESDQRGVLVIEVVEDSPAGEAGLQGSDTQKTIDGLPAQIGGDVIVQIDDQPVADFDDLLTYIVRETEVGDTVTLTILRDGELQAVELTLEARPTNSE
ncbi:MAG TPA: trypsin-like peptidase domain-containing protein [Anaerolineae bacterium]